MPAVVIPGVAVEVVVVVSVMVVVTQLYLSTLEPILS
jgi:hypothetical protein